MAAHSKHEPNTATNTNQKDAQPPIVPPEEHNTPKWMAYYRTVDRILGQQRDPELNLAMRQAAAACGLHAGVPQEQEATTQRRGLHSMVNAIWCDKQDLHLAIHSHNTHTH